MKEILITTRSETLGWQGVVVDGAYIGIARERHGNWCVNLCEILPGIDGFGKTPEAAILDAVYNTRKQASALLYVANVIEKKVGINQDTADP